MTHAIPGYPRLREGHAPAELRGRRRAYLKAVARLNGDINDIALREQRLQTADDPTAGIQREALGVEVDANEAPRAVGKFENEACDRYAVVVELALSVGCEQLVSP